MFVDETKIDQRPNNVDDSNYVLPYDFNNVQNLQCIYRNYKSSQHIKI